jgi:hypothetical protein
MMALHSSRLTDKIVDIMLYAYVVALPCDMRLCFRVEEPLLTPPLVHASPSTTKRN